MVISSRIGGKNCHGKKINIGSIDFFTKILPAQLEVNNDAITYQCN